VIGDVDIGERKSITSYGVHAVSDYEPKRISLSQVTEQSPSTHRLSSIQIELSIFIGKVIIKMIIKVK